jgi:hypothetical protein
MPQVEYDERIHPHELKPYLLEWVPRWLEKPRMLLVGRFDPLKTLR